MAVRNFSFIPSSPVALADLVKKVEAEKGFRVVRFDVAEPCFDPPPIALTATVKALEDGYIRYTPTKGIFELREALASFLKSTRGLSYNPENEIMVTNGAKFAVYAFFASVVEAGDEVILLSPYWVSFKAVVMLFGGKTVEVSTREPYHIDEEKLKNAITSRTKAIVVNTPNNPTGGVMPKDELKILVDLAEDYNLFILSDEIDWAYIYDGREHVSPASIGNGKERTLIVDGFSKVFSMTGWRIGYAAGPKNLIDAMNVIQQHSVTGPTTFAQKACVDVLSDAKSYLEDIVRKCDKKRRFLVEGLRSIEDLRFSLPEGAFYLYSDASHYRLRSYVLAEKMLNKVGVAVTPGSLFSDGDYKFRICYALPDEDLKTGVERMKKFFKAVENP